MISIEGFTTKWMHMIERDLPAAPIVAWNLMLMTARGVVTHVRCVICRFSPKRRAETGMGKNGADSVEDC